MDHWPCAVGPWPCTVARSSGRPVVQGAPDRLPAMSTADVEHDRTDFGRGAFTGVPWIAAVSW
ncbi:hypothetical protein QA943_37260 [Streptomyces sp. B21-097]|uniref:hypothetical protein n=1 Tax=Streptomyces sp. B21-097 TaxID=3039414 RepID=UPI002FF2D435